MDVNQAYLEYPNEKSLSKCQISTSVINEPVHNATNYHGIEKEQDIFSCLERLTLVSKDRINIITHYDLYKSFIYLIWNLSIEYCKIQIYLEFSMLQDATDTRIKRENIYYCGCRRRRNCLPETVSEELECL
jgi:hypothetical protein